MRHLSLLATLTVVSLVSTAAFADGKVHSKKAPPGNRPPSAPLARAATPPAVAPVAAPAAAPGAAASTTAASTTAASTTSSAQTLARDFNALPRFESKVPSQMVMPASIPAGEKVDGVYLEMPEYARKQTNKASRYVQIFASEADAKARNSGQPSTYGGVCFQTGSPSVDGDREIRWNGSLSPYASVAPYPKSYGPNGPNLNDMASVYPLMSQKIADKGADRVELETKMMLVDASTLGVRLVAAEKAEYMLVKQIPGRIRVYASRDDDEVSFLVRSDRHPEERFSMGNMFVSQTFNSVSASEGCHMTFKLKAQQDKAATAVAHLEVLMDVKPMVSSDEAPRGLDSLTRAGDLRGTEAKEARIRAMQIGFSTSWMSLDAQPVISISHGWVGRERTQQM